MACSSKPILTIARPSYLGGLAVLVIGLVVPSLSTAKPFKIIAASNPRITTHQLKSGAFTIGITDNAGGIINQVILPGLGDIMGPATDPYGRAGQVAIRDGSHGGRYNPTQSGFNEELGTQCEITQTATKLVVEPRPLALWHGDGQYDFTQWENIGPDPYDNDSGRTDVDGLDESTLVGKQETEVQSEFDYYGTYENVMGKDGIKTSAIHHYFEIGYVRNPGHCINQFRPGTALWNERMIRPDMSRLAPAGVHRGTHQDMNGMIAVWSLRNDRSIWLPKYVHYRSADKKWHSRLADSGIGSNSDETVFINADSANPLKGIALGLYRPKTDINLFTLIGKNRSTEAIAYKDDRFTQTGDGFGIMYDLERAPALAKYGFAGKISGMLNPTHFTTNTYEAFRSEYYILYGTPQEIMDAVAAIDKVDGTVSIHYPATMARAELSGQVLTIHSDSYPVNIQLFDLKGAVNYSTSVHQATRIDLNTLPRGAHVLRISGKTFSQEQRLVVVR